MRLTLILVGALLAACATSNDGKPEPIFDGHADFAIHYARGNPSWSIGRHDLERLPGQADLLRWKAGGVGGILATVGSGLPTDAPSHFPAVLTSMEWLEALGQRYKDKLVLARSPADVGAAWRADKLAMTAALEGADQLDGKLANLQVLARRGLRSLLIVYDHHNRYGDGAEAFLGSAGRPAHGGLSEDGRALVREANRLGVIIDLSHAAESTALDAIAASRSPVIFSHSGARGLAETPRNLSDAVLKLVGQTGGIVMVPLVPYLTTHAHWRWFDSGEREYARLVAAHGEGSAAVDQGMALWDQANPEPRVTVDHIADQIEYIARIAGRRHVGIGTDFDGMGRFAVADLADASKLPVLFAELRRRGWSRDELDALASGNFLRVWSKVQANAER